MIDTINIDGVIWLKFIRIDHQIYVQFLIWNDDLLFWQQSAFLVFYAVSLAAEKILDAFFDCRLDIENQQVARVILLKDVI